MKEKVQLLLIERPIVLLLGLFFVLIFFSFLSLFLLEREGLRLSVVDSLFTAFSAATVTGLTVQNTSSFSAASQVVILLTIQTGAFMAMGGAVFLIMLARNTGRLYEGSVSAASLFLGRAWRNMRFVAVFVLSVEGFASALLFLHFKDSMGMWQGLWYSTFHSVSAFCNAGFFLFSDNFYSLRGDVFVLSVIMSEIILGGLGFLVIISLKINLLGFLKRKKVYGWPIHAKLTLIMSTALILLGFVVFWGLERQGALKNVPESERVLVSVFQSVSARTAGFSTIDMESVSSATQFFFSALMFIGAGTMSVSGGIKVTTFAVVLLLIWSRYRRRRIITVYDRLIPQETTSRANGVFLLSFAIVSLFIFLLLIFENAKLGDISFEASSAFGTVGLSTGVTPLLSPVGKVLLSTLMLIGRIGPLALTYILGREIMDERSSKLFEEVEVG